MNAGLYPETLPPCFVSSDAKRAFYGLSGKLDDAKFSVRKTNYVRYSGTKHDGSRRFFATPNIVSYFQTSSFIWRNWRKFESNYALSKYSIGAPKVMDEGDERAVKVPSLSELSKRTSANLGYAPFILKADIAQCFPSVYTHSIAWAAHGINESKADTEPNSAANKFNALDFFVRNSQRGNTRGVLVGPDGYRLIAEFVLSKIDSELEEIVGDTIVGAVRHVDDYYIGLRTEHDAQSVLSHLREVLATYELNLNDQKTKIHSSLDPINDLWAQRLRDHVELGWFGLSHEKIERAVSEAVDSAKKTGSDSPIKILIRAFDEWELYSSEYWDFVEQNLLRIVQKHPHALDYACLIVAKRAALGLQVDKNGWLSVAEIVVGRSLALNHHHETLWLVWLLIVCGIRMPMSMEDELAKSRNAHIRALVVQAHIDGVITRKPKLALGSGLSSADENWLVNLVARSQDFSKARFSDCYAEEFEFLADRNINLIYFNQHIENIQAEGRRAISRTRYGYDDDEDEDEDDLW
ncbi:RNA-directed DNA polymerase [Maritimibacter alkaliphilus]|uniref:RNA-directed DNA polymerase n=1 Tax=Maritimibacter alkaliphilus TaxID=404236 RepID=UPI001C93FE53|nr:RNA-directed DNA polymerase [Maritimibacter alkaliphilus]MBY6088960.1 RNA-directed DNA polymerase [Maritimibacter alkaliphilus]